MENQHRKITGYRELNAAEIALINDIKAHAGAGEALMTRVKEHVTAQATAGHADAGIATRLARAEPMRWLAIARTDAQTSNMALTRAVAQPENF